MAAHDRPTELGGPRPDPLRLPDGILLGNDSVIGDGRSPQWVYSFWSPSARGGIAVVYGEDGTTQKADLPGAKDETPLPSWSIESARAAELAMARPNFSRAATAPDGSVAWSLQASSAIGQGFMPLPFGRHAVWAVVAQSNAASASDVLLLDAENGTIVDVREMMEHMMSSFQQAFAPKPGCLPGDPATVVDAGQGGRNFTVTHPGTTATSARYGSTDAWRVCIQVPAGRTSLSIRVEENASKTSSGLARTVNLKDPAGAWPAEVAGAHDMFKATRPGLYEVNLSLQAQAPTPYTASVTLSSDPFPTRCAATRPASLGAAGDANGTAAPNATAAFAFTPGGPRFDVNVTWPNGSSNYIMTSERLVVEVLDPDGAPMKGSGGILQFSQGAFSSYSEDAAGTFDARFDAKQPGNYAVQVCLPPGWSHGPSPFHLVVQSPARAS
jgi:hypothetical protein